MKILFDGWPLSRAPNSPAALHLYTLLTLLPAEVERLVALPDPPPGWLGAGFALVEPAPRSAFSQLLWEQRTLPRLAHNSGCDLLHSASPGAPLFGPPISVVSPSGFGKAWHSTPAATTSAGKPPPTQGDPEEHLPLIRRLQEALANGGLARVRAILWPADLPQPDLPAQVIPIPPVVHPAFSPIPGPVHLEAPIIDLPDTYLLYHGPTSRYWVQVLLEAWSWAGGAIGEYYPLLILGTDSAGWEHIGRLLDEYQLADSVRLLPQVPTPALPSIYQGCTAVFHPAPLSPWGCPIRSALACGKPVVALESQMANEVVGPAAFLVPPGKARSLGAALITVVVEPEVSESLSRKALDRATAWREVNFGARLAETYQLLIPPISSPSQSGKQKHPKPPH